MNMFKGVKGLTDSEVKTLMQKSAEAAHRRIFDEYSGYVYSICANKLKSCGTKEDIEECFSDIFADVFRYLDGNSGENGDLKGIIGTIAKRTAVDYFRRLTRNNDIIVSMDDENFKPLISGELVEVEAEKAEIRRILLDCIEKLGKPDSQIVVYHFFYGKTSREIAKIIDMNDWTVQKRLSRAKKKLKVLLCDAGINEEGF